MSRIGKKPILVPATCKVAVNAATREVAITGPKGETLKVIHRPEVSVAWNEADRMIVCTTDMTRLDQGNRKAFWGTTRANIANMVKGVTDGYTEKLEIVGVGYSAKMVGTRLDLKLGYANIISLAIPTGVKLVIATENGIFLTITGADRQRVGEFASAIRSKRKPEPYNGKGVKYVGEVIIRKQGKASGG
ncbi:MAG: 50S ribosomal protein L6 [Planctomycetota bacterium]|jgi:large subunit ribosomal protein L6|nr:MAG: 50S ribosomal protein L6 [Planctomycetota bacterium]RLS91962.1 MAG: 50S ribosomal protein L6 [Planctomycetota bacterium]